MKKFIILFLFIFISSGTFAKINKYSTNIGNINCQVLNYTAKDFDNINNFDIDENLNNFILSVSKNDLTNLVYNGKKIILDSGEENFEEVGEMSYPNDLSKISFIYEDEEIGDIAVKQGKKINKYSEIKMVIYSQNGKSFSLLAEKNNGKNIVEKDGKILVGEFDKISNFGYLKGTQTISFLAEKGEDFYLYKDEKLFFKGKNIVEFKYSPDLKNILYSSKNKKTGIYNIFYNDKNLGNYDYIADFGFSKNGKSYAFIAKKDNNYFLIKDGKIIKKAIYIINFQLSPDGKKISYIYEKNGKKIIEENGKNLGTYDFIKDYKYSPNSKKLAFIGIKDNKYYLYLNGKILGVYDFIKEFKFSKYGDSFAFLYRKNNLEIINKDGKDLGTYNFIKEFYFLGDTKEIILVIENKNLNDYLVINNKKSNIFPNIYNFNLKNGKIHFVSKKENNIKFYSCSIYNKEKISNIIDIFIKNKTTEKLSEILSRIQKITNINKLKYKIFLNLLEYKINLKIKN